MSRGEALAEPGAASESELSQYEFLVFSPCWRPQQTPPPPTTTPFPLRPPGPKKEGRGTNCHHPPGSGASVCLPPAWLRLLCDYRQVKIMTEKELLAVACEQFLGKSVQDIKNVVLQTLEGHLRSILGEALPGPGTPLPLPPARSHTASLSQGQGGERGPWTGGPVSPAERLLAEKLTGFPSCISFQNIRRLE